MVYTINGLSMKVCSCTVSSGRYAMIVTILFVFGKTVELLIDFGFDSFLCGAIMG
jgi:hypothetical protein